MSGLRTEYEFVLPRGFLDENGELHKRGIMRLATARDELEPLRDPTINTADDPRLTIIILARVVETLGTLSLVTADEIENLFAADLAYLQDFYGVINFGTGAEIDAMLEAQKANAPTPLAEAPVAEVSNGTATEGGADAPAAPRRSAVEEPGRRA